jgi:hypothetical protein
MYRGRETGEGERESDRSPAASIRQYEFSNGSQLTSVMAATMAIARGRASFWRGKNAKKLPFA